MTCTITSRQLPGQPSALVSAALRGAATSFTMDYSDYSDSSSIMDLSLTTKFYSSSTKMFVQEADFWRKQQLELQEMPKWISVENLNFQDVKNDILMSFKKREQLGSDDDLENLLTSFAKMQYHFLKRCDPELLISVRRAVWELTKAYSDHLTSLKDVIELIPKFASLCSEIAVKDKAFVFADLSAEMISFVDLLRKEKPELVHESILTALFHHHLVEKNPVLCHLAQWIFYMITMMGSFFYAKI